MQVRSPVFLQFVLSYRSFAQTEILNAPNNAGFPFLRNIKDPTIFETSVSVLFDYLADKNVSIALQMKAGAKFSDCNEVNPSQIEIWYRGSQPHALQRNIPISQTGVPFDSNMELSLVVTGIKLTRSSVVNDIPEAIMTTPIPVAIQVKFHLYVHP